MKPNSVVDRRLQLATLRIRRGKTRTLGGILLGTEPTIGKLYFMVKYADDKLTRPIIGTYEFKRREPKDVDDQEYLFEDIASGDELILRQRDLWNMVDMPGLIEELKRFHAAGRGGTTDAS